MGIWTEKVRLIIINATVSRSSYKWNILLFLLRLDLSCYILQQNIIEYYQVKDML